MAHDRPGVLRRDQAQGKVPVDQHAQGLIHPSATNATAKQDESRCGRCHAVENAGRRRMPEETYVETQRE
eukprot:5774609-Pyramimonas_sp.AAC.1